jgi:hypothetical protein
VVTNYDRLHLFDPTKFGGVVLDESSIIKSSDGKTRAQLMEFCADVPYLLPASATPAPNDWTELGQHAELLGVMTAKEMLSMYFVHDGSNRAHGGDGWRLKRHAEDDVLGLGGVVGGDDPPAAGLGFDEAGYDLPPLNRYPVVVEGSPLRPGELFKADVGDLRDRLAERRESIPQRVRAAATSPSASAISGVHWCHLNDEADAMVKAIPGAVNLSGTDTREQKVEKLLAFTRGDIQDLVTKPSIASKGLNWQHCRRHSPASA